MSGHRPWKEIRGAADRDPARRRRVEAARRKAKGEQTTRGEIADQESGADDTDAANCESLSPASPHP